jgi:hypothetical protein
MPVIEGQTGIFDSLLIFSHPRLGGGGLFHTKLVAYEGRYEGKTNEEKKEQKSKKVLPMCPV